MASSTLCKIHVNNSTGVSLNERFTAMSSQPKVTVGGRSRSRSVERSLPRIDHATTRANQRFLAELQRKHKLQAAMKLKRRSMRTVGGGPGGAYGRIKRGSVKALRVGANGKPMRTNSLANIATMNADREVLKRRTTPLRRSNSSGSLSNRLGPRRPLVGGAAQRIARRRLDRQRGGVVEKGGRSLTSGGRIVGRSRSRNRSLTRVPDNGRSRSRSRNQNTGTDVRGRSRSRSRNPVQTRSLSRNRGYERPKSSLPIKARLGVRPGTNANAVQNNRRVNKNRRSASLPRGGVENGRVQKKRNLGSRNAAIKAGVNINRPRSRSAIRNANEQQRSRSRTRRGQVGQQRVQGQVQNRDSNQLQQRGRGQVLQRGTVQTQQRRPGQTKQRGAGQDRQRGPGQARQRGPNQGIQRRRGRSQQRQGVANNAQKGSPNPKANNQQRSGRSRSRTGNVGRGGPRNQGKATKGTVNKDALDKELDQYMATTKTVNDMDFLLKN